MNLRQIYNVDRSSKILLISLVLLVLFYLVLLLPIINENNQLKIAVKNESNLSQYLFEVNQEMSIKPSYQVLSQDQTSALIENAFKNKGVELDELELKGKTYMITISKIPFSDLLETLQQLKVRNGIIVNKAVIESIEPMLVSSELTFSTFY